MTKSLRLLLPILLALLAATFALTVAAQDDTVTDDEVNEIARDIYCPVCESTPLDVCQTQACADWRELIRTKLAEGETKQDIFEYFARQYGDGVLANPPRRGVSLIILWVLPVALILLGLLFFGRVMRGLRAAGAEATAVPYETVQTPAAKADPDDYLARVQEELEGNNE